MSLANTLFKFSAEDNGKVTYHIDETHVIFNGHFPNHPILPAVTMLQLLKAETERQVNQRLRLKTMSNAKFLKVVNPLKDNRLSVVLKITSEDNQFKVSASLSQGDRVVTKLSAVYTKSV